MHEMALAESILDIIEATARRQGAVRVREVRLEIGELANVEMTALECALQAALRDSLAEGARIECLVIPGQGLCLTCGETVPLAALYDLCPRCDGYPVQPTSGQELRVKDILVE
ncbi:MAG TPA: hydrogenase maturation nickel metallochaperone HypA [Candidatus Competibacteraceae bacterium]|nr:hydrogenase maturation nickel metallochaperone HypA [Candidatus Competibacteraceae bacterium]HRZ06221.1 hydrogenase maturation nickel metallochaperone HypA [Candidatus Competibacteraceae bacterium]HSA46532.1 hydrogenase maturation nickel metallochaperone HypA [Candidatus Competibacteraceae bacterium]